MAVIVNGNIMGVKLYGECNGEDLKNFAEFGSAVNALRESLSKLFNAEMAEKVMENVMRGTQISISEGEVENRAEWEEMFERGYVYKSKSEFEKRLQ